jgi:hypothetical protein
MGHHINDEIYSSSAKLLLAVEQISLIFASRPNSGSAQSSRRHNKE